MATSVKNWLESLKLEQYLVVLEDGGFDTIEKCALITVTDLDRLGVTLPEYQQRMLNSLPKFDASSQDPATKVEFYDVPATLTDQTDIQHEPEVYENLQDTSPPSAQPIKQPVPQPRKAINKKPVPKPRTFGKKNPVVSSMKTKVSVSSDRSSMEIQATDPSEPFPGYSSARKTSIKVLDVTETETDLDLFSSSDNKAIFNSSDSDECSEYIPMTGSVKANEDATEIKHETDGHLELRSSSGEGTSSLASSILDRDTNLPVKETATIALSATDLDYLEKWQSKQKSATDNLSTEQAPDMLTKCLCSIKPSSGLSTTLDQLNNDVFDEKPSFNTEAAIPQSLDEWDQATARKSFVLDSREISTASGCMPQDPSDVTHGSRPRDDSCEALATNVQTIQTDSGKGNNIQTSNQRTPDLVALEELENQQNEMIYSEVKLAKQLPDLDEPVYMPVWKAQSAKPDDTIRHQYPDVFNMSPPKFSPPPLPPEVKLHTKPKITSRSPQLPKRNMLPSPEISQRDLPPPPPPNRTTSVKPSSQDQQQSQTSTKQKPIVTGTDDHLKGIQNNPLQPVPCSTGEKITPLVQREKLEASAAATRESFTDLARDRIFAKSGPISVLPSIPQEASPPKAAPAPPPRQGPKLLQNVCTTENRFSHQQDDPASPSVYDDIQSDDTFSDGGDWCESFSMPSKEVRKEAIPILPVSQIQNKTPNRSGYLFKKASQDSIHRMGSMWTKRWVTLDEKYLTYCSARKHSDTKRLIPVKSLLDVHPSIKELDSHPYQFCVKSVDRIYTFSTDTADDLSVWCTTIMLAIMSCKDDFVEGGEMNLPDKEGLIKVENMKNKRYFALKGDRLCYYMKPDDFKAGTPIAKIDLKLTNLKELGKNRLQLLSSTVKLVLVMDTADDLNKWKRALEDAIAEGLGEDSVLNEVYENHSNRFCADCQVSGPQWASVNLGITLCKHCAGIHRKLTIPVSKVRSITMDTSVWNPALIKLLQTIGNDNANKFWQWHLKQENSIDANSDMTDREEHIILKYRNKKFCKLHPLKGDQSALNEALHKAVQYSDVLETMQLLFTGADILSRGPDNQTPLELAQKTNQELQVEFLCQNGAEGSGQMPVTTSMVEEQMNAGAAAFISHRGYLFKTGSNVKEDFLKRWCVLEHGFLSYYENDKSTSPKNKIGIREMMSVTLTTDPRFEFTFELATIRHGRVYLFAAEVEEDRRKWVSLIAKTIAPIPRDLLVNVRDFTRAGVAHIKQGSTEKWSKCWLQIKNRLLFYCHEDCKEFEKIDLRKVKNINLVNNISETCRDVYEEGPMFVLSLYKDSSRTYNTLYIQSEIGKETEAWYNVIQALTKKAGKTVDDQPLTDENIPVIVDKCISFIILHGMKTCGIYRLNGQHSKVTKLLEGFQKDARELVLRLEDYNVHDVATVLKRFFRSLEEPLLVQSIYPKWLNTAAIKEQSMKLQWYQYLVRELPFINYCTLKKLIRHLRHVADEESENKMGSTNISSIFGPLVMTVDQDGNTSGGFASTSQEIAVFKDLMDMYVHVFEVNEQEIEYENKMHEAQKKIEEAMKKCAEKKSASQELLLPVYLYSKDKQVFTIKVTASTTAEELLQQVIQKAKLTTNKQLAIFECICNEELERPLHNAEKVLPITLRWAEWPQELSKDNMLCIKVNHVYSQTELVFDPYTPLFSELKYSEKKGFKKFCFEFSHMQMSYKKDSRSSSPIASWNIEDLTVYIGIQQKRNPPTVWGFSFIKNDEKIQGSMFGHSVCCNTKEELYRWLAAIIHGQKIGPSRIDPNTSSSAGAFNNSLVRESDASLTPVDPDPSSSSRNRRFKNFIINKLMHKS